MELKLNIEIKQSSKLVAHLYKFSCKVLSVCAHTPLLGVYLAAPTVMTRAMEFSQTEEI